MVRGAKLSQARRPPVFEPWLPVATAAVGVVLLVVAGLVDAVRIPSAVLAGAVLALSAVLGVVTWYVRRTRRRIRRWIARRLPEINPESRSR
jgi:hypothetical protein